MQPTVGQVLQSPVFSSTGAIFTLELMKAFYIPPTADLLFQNLPLQECLQQNLFSHLQVQKFRLLPASFVLRQTLQIYTMEFSPGIIMVSQREFIHWTQAQMCGRQK